uniref:TSA: Wollemia nobilis Ref_Wollemi_Transcript_1304_1922 transcribed RNA sequence n=1 Tax=Wollemia nobilis TaxID=56998 RepID=A0A0C9QXL3_9CONI
MRIRKRELLFFWSLIGILSTLQAKMNDLSRDDFPPGFIFGAGTSAYQVEGAAAEDGRKPSIWDPYTHAGKMLDGSTGDVAADQYHHYKEDVGLMFEMGLDAYRFSISWSRLIPDGRGAINPKGLEYYNALIDELIRHGIEPHITLYHFDFPQSLEDAYGGWLSPQIIEDFRAYAEVCFKEFGDRVKYWTTFNEPNAFPSLAYDIGWWPPERCSYPFGFFGNCSDGNSTVEPYIVGHNLLLSHAAAVEIYREKFQAKQKGFIGITILGIWFVPLTNSSKDISATQRTFDFFNGWFVEPIVHGDYPSSMKEVVGSRLPTFTKQEREKLRGSYDFIGLNHYNTFYVYNLSNHSATRQRDFLRDLGSNLTDVRNGIPIGKRGPSGLPVVPWGMQALLEYFKQSYDNPPIIIYENGYGLKNNESLSLPDALNDTGRLEYLHDYLESLLAAIRNGSNTRGYFVWSMVDAFEFLFGYQIRYGLYYVDFKGANRERHATRSAGWYTKFLKGRKYNYKHIDLWKRISVSKEDGIHISTSLSVD